VADEIDPTYLPFSERHLNECLAAASKSRINHANESEDSRPERIGSGTTREARRNIASIGRILNCIALSGTQNSSDRSRKMNASGPRRL